MYVKLDTVKQSNNAAIYNTLRGVFDETPVSRQAFEQARKNLSYTAFEELFSDTAQEALELQDLKLFKGVYRLLGIDGSLVALPKSEELAVAFGKSTPVEGETFCRISFCADLLNEFVLGGEISGFDTGERELAQKHLDKVPCPNGLFLFDRGYWSPELIPGICRSGRKFLIRIPSNGIHAVTQSKEPSGTFKYRGYPLRYYVFQLKSGEMEYLVTNLCADEVPDEALPDLYALRWGVETRYREFKNELKFIQFSGKSELFVRQDFYAYLTVMNLIAAAMYDADEIVQQQRKDSKYQHKPSKAAAMNILKLRYLRATVEKNPQKKSFMFSQLIEDIARFTVPIRPGRHFPRNMPRDRKCMKIMGT